MVIEKKYLWQKENLKFNDTDMKQINAAQDVLVILSFVEIMERFFLKLLIENRKN